MPSCQHCSAGASAAGVLSPLSNPPGYAPLSMDALSLSAAFTSVWWRLFSKCRSSRESGVSSIATMGSVALLRPWAETDEIRPAKVQKRFNIVEPMLRLGRPYEMVGLRPDLDEPTW